MRRGEVVAVARAELLFNVKRPAVWVIALLAAGNAVLWWCAGPAEERGWATNSDLYVARLAVGFGFLTAPFLTATLMGDAIARDVRVGVAPLLLASPIGRAEYVLGKFAGKLAALALAFGAFAATGIALQAVPFEGMLVLPWRIVPFASHFVVFVLVPHAALGALCLAIGAATHSAKARGRKAAPLFVAALGAELRLLAAERALCAIVPVVAVLSGAFAGAFGSASGAPLLPLSSIYAANSAQSLLWLLSCVSAFTVGELVHRDRAARVEPIVWSAPASNAVLLGSKYAAVMLLAVGLALLAAATALVAQLVRGATAVELAPYATVYLAVLLPGVAIVAAVALAVHVLARDRLLGHAISIGLGGALLYVFYLGYTNWLYNPILYGLLDRSSTYFAFVDEGGTFLGGPSATGWYPTVGYRRSLEVDGAGGGWGQRLPFDLRVEVTVPVDQTAVSSGRLVEVREGGDRRTFVYETERPVMAFPILAARYAELRRGDLAVFHHRGHAANAAAILDALEAARARFERAYGALPWRDLRVVEFPRIAAFAESFQTTIAFSEGSDFLTSRDASRVDAISFVVAHEAAHQWFGNLVEPEGRPGSDVLVEGLAEYAAGTLIEDALGAEAAIVFRRHEEETYLRHRAADGEPPLAALEGGYGPHGVVASQKGGMVLHMLEREIGREQMDAAIAEYVARFAGGGRPTIDDLLAILERRAPEGFLDQWFRRVLVPDARVVRASSRRDGDVYVAEAVLANAGEGRATVAVAVDGGAAATVTVEAGRDVTVELRCPFAPSRVVVDPGYDILDANRENNAREIDHR